MKSMLIPVKPKGAAKILNGDKTIEFRKNAPKDWMGYLSGETKIKPKPRTAYICCTKGNRFLFKDKSGEHFLARCLVGSLPPLNAKVVAKFTLREVEKVHYDAWGDHFYTERDDFRTDVLPGSCLTYKELKAYYFKNELKVGCYAYHISDLVLFDEPLGLNKFEKVGSYENPTIVCKKKERGECNRGRSPFTGEWVGCEKAQLTKSPQSWCYVETREEVG